MRRREKRRSIIGYKQNLMPIAIDMLRIRARKYGVELQRRLLGILSTIYYRIIVLNVSII
jgi:DNA transposition AAA+ family ATPase